MRQLPAALQAHLDTGATTLCNCWLVQPTSGRKLGFTDHDRKVHFDGTDFEPQSGFTGSAIETSLGLSVDDQDVTGVLQSESLDEASLRAGRFDDAEVKIWIVNWSDPAQRFLIKRGQIGEIVRGPTAFTAEVRSLTDRLHQHRGRVFQHGCDAYLGDERCGVDKSLSQYSAPAIVEEVLEARRLLVSGLQDFNSGWFSHGSLSRWVDGTEIKLSEIRVHVLQAVTSRLELAAPAADGLQPGDPVTVTAGCDRRFETCREKFANTENYRGFPHMPGNDFVTTYPTSDDGGHDGSSRN